LALRSELKFGVPAALVNLDGGYGLPNFQGTLTLDVKVSETTSGVKSLLLKTVDRLLPRDGEGSVCRSKYRAPVQSPASAVAESEP